MRPRIAIPVPHSGDPDYAARALPQYERAVEMAGGDPVRIPLDRSPGEVMKLIERCDAVLLPGSKADVDPAKYSAPSHPKTAAADAGRDTVDELLLQDAYNMKKPVLGICYGLQALNVYRSGTLNQDIESAINHPAGRRVDVAHTVEVEPGSRLAKVLFRENREGHGFSRAEESQNRSRALAPEGDLTLPVNSSHHQSAEVVGDGLRVVARSPEDGIVEAIEGTSPDHFVLAVQWHPERSVDNDEPSRAIFRALVEAAAARHGQVAGKFKSP